MPEGFLTSVVAGGVILFLATLFDEFVTDHPLFCFACGMLLFGLFGYGAALKGFSFPVAIMSVVAYLLILLLIVRKQLQPGDVAWEICMAVLHVVALAVGYGIVAR